MPIEMSDSTRDLLMSVPPADVRAPLRERRYLDTDAKRITALFEDDGRRARLGKTGYDLNFLDLIKELAEIYSKSRAATLGSDAVSSGSKREEAITEGEAEAAIIVAACRFQLGHIEGMSLKLDAAAVATGALDLAIDLDVLAVIVENNISKFARNELFDAPKHIALAREHANKVRTLVEAEEAPPELGSTRDLRNRASTLLWSRLLELRTAASFAFSGDEQVLRELRIRRR